MAETGKRVNKRKLINRLYANFSKYKQVIIVNLENVGSN